MIHQTSMMTLQSIIKILFCYNFILPSKRTVLGILNKDGTYAEYLTLPVVNLYPVPAGVSNAQATFAGRLFLV